MLQNAEIVILALRLLLVAAIYLLLLWVALIVRRGAIQPANRSTAGPPRRLVVVATASGGPPIGTAIALQPRTTIGRAGDNLIVLPDPTVSGHHAALALRGSHWWVEDLGSTNGTLVNGRMVRGALPVGDGDEVQVGPARFRVTT